MKEELRGAPRIVQAQGHVFMDVDRKVVSLINAASVRDLERVVGRPIDPLRFRGNLLVEDLPAWREFDWIGKPLRIGTARFEVWKRIKRCPATNVEPGTGLRDMQIPQALMTGYGHVEMGIYMRVTVGGEIAENDRVELA
jgi:hypothetical protein